MKAKEIAKFTKKNLKDAKKLSEDLNTMYKDVEKTRNKYKKSFLDWEDAKDNFMKAEKDGILSRKEIAKLKSMSNSRNAQCEDYKGVYASQLVKTNKYQEKYYYKDLPGVINSLQNIEIDRIEYIKQALNQCVAPRVETHP
jgi:cysteinyl-tRNA synthetase